MQPRRAESLAAIPPLPISLNHHPLCGVPLPATLYQTTSLKWHIGTQRQSCDAFSGSGKRIKPRAMVASGASVGIQDQSNHTIYFKRQLTTLVRDRMSMARVLDAFVLLLPLLLPHSGLSPVALLIY